MANRSIGKNAIYREKLAKKLGMRILLIEDDEALVDMLLQCLTSQQRVRQHVSHLAALNCVANTSVYSTRYSGISS